jgi:hypothetical protein
MLYIEFITKDLRATQLQTMRSGPSSDCVASVA